MSTEEEEPLRRSICMKLKEYNLLMSEEEADKDWINRWLAFSEKFSKEYMKLIYMRWWESEIFSLGDAELAKKAAKLLHLIDSINLNEDDKEKLRKLAYEIAEHSMPALEFLTDYLCHEEYWYGE